MSWRDETPQEVQDDLDQLADESLSAATAFLEKNGEALFVRLPYRSTAGRDGRRRSGSGEHPVSQAVLDLLYEGIAAQRDGTRAVAFTSMVETTDGDAVRRDRAPRRRPRALLLPYRPRRLPPLDQFGEISSQHPASAGSGADRPCTNCCGSRAAQTKRSKSTFASPSSGCPLRFRSVYVTWKPA